jgi:hypothetical protein
MRLAAKLRIILRYAKALGQELFVVFEAVLRMPPARRGA